MEDVLYLARKGFIVREMFGDYMLVPQDTSGIYINEAEQLPEFNGMIELNELGIFIWEEIQEPKTFSQLIDSIKENFDTGNQDITNDILEFLEEGYSNQIIFKGFLNKDSRVD